MVRLLTSFSPKMIKQSATIKFKELTSFKELPQTFDFIQAAHPGAAALFSKLLNKKIEVDRTPVRLKPGDICYIVMSKFRIEPGQEIPADPNMYAVYRLEVRE